jgi:hypothetical protein
VAVLELLEETALELDELETLLVWLLLELLALGVASEPPLPPQAIRIALNSAALSQVVIFFMRPSFCMFFIWHRQHDTRHC